MRADKQQPWQPTQQWNSRSPLWEDQIKRPQIRTFVFILLFKKRGGFKWAEGLIKSCVFLFLSVICSIERLCWDLTRDLALHLLYRHSCLKNLDHSSHLNTHFQLDEAAQPFTVQRELIQITLVWKVYWFNFKEFWFSPHSVGLVLIETFWLL